MTQRRSKGWIGLELGHRSITIAQVQRSARTVCVTAACEMPRTAPTPGAAASCETYQDVSGHELETARLLAGRISGRAAACVLPMSATELTHASLPPAEPAEQHAMVANELGARGQQFDFWPSELRREEDSSDLLDVNVISVSEKLAAEVAQTLMAARLDCRILDGLPHAVARAVEMAVPSHFGRPLAAMHLAYDGAMFVLSRDGVPVFTRQLRDVGMHRIVARVSESLALSEEEAVHVLREFGLPEAKPRHCEAGQLQEIISEIAEGPLEEIADEFQRTLSYLSSFGAEAAPDSVCLLGDGAAIRNLASYLTTKTDVSMWNWSLPGAQWLDTVSGAAPALAVAVALSSLAWEP